VREQCRAATVSETNLKAARDSAMEGSAIASEAARRQTPASSPARSKLETEDLDDLKGSSPSRRKQAAKDGPGKASPPGRCNKSPGASNKGFKRRKLLDEKSSPFGVVTSPPSKRCMQIPKPRIAVGSEREGWRVTSSSTSILNSLRFDHPISMFALPNPRPVQALSHSPSTVRRVKYSTDGAPGATRDTQVPMIRVISPTPQPKTPREGIPSRTFARVVRLLVGIPTPAPKVRKGKCPAPDGNPPVWAEVRVVLPYTSLSPG
jgi:hypothetical protein